MIKTALIIHDSYTNPSSGWYPWASRALTDRGITVYIPTLPTPVAQSYSSWRVMCEPYLKHVGPETVIIGHGTGALFALRLISELTTPIAGCIAISPFIEPVPNQGLTAISQTFLSPDIEWRAVRAHCSAYVTIAATSDPFVPIEIARRASDTMGGSFVSVTHEGHFLAESQELPELLTALDTLSAQQTISDTQASQLAAAGINLSDTTQPSSSDNAYTTIEPVQKVHTYQQDMTTHITTGDAASMATLLEEEREKESQKKQQQNKAILGSIYAALTIIVIAIGVWFLMNRATDTAIPLPKLSHTATPLKAEHTLVVAVPNDKVAAITALENAWTSAPKDQNSVTLITPTDMSQRPIGFNTLMDTIGARVPTELRATITNYLYGVHTSDRPYPFLLVAVNNFDQGFSGMRAWEQLMPIDLYRSMISSSNNFTRKGLENPTVIETEIKNRAIRQIMIARSHTVTRTIPKTDMKFESDFPRIISYTSSMGGVFVGNTITWKKLPASLESMKVSDILVVTTSKSPRAYLIQNISVTETGTVATVRDAQATELFGINHARDGYTIDRQSEQGTVFIKTVDTTETAVEDLPAEAALVTAFLNDHILVIATNKETIDELARRITTNALFSTSTR